MAKYIAHARLDENGNISGGKAGDQSGREVEVRTWYNHPWNYVLRIKNEKIRKQFANNMIDLAKNIHIGYDQNQRNSLLTQAKKVNFNFSKITVNCECDCSSSITICILGAIYILFGEEEYEKAYNVLVVSGNCATTTTLRSRLNKLGMIAVYSSSTYVSGTSKAVFGDIYIKEGSHVVCYVEDGDKVSVSNTSSTPSNSTSSSSSSKVPTYIVGKVYTLQAELKVRTGAGTNYAAKKHSELTSSAQSYDKDKDGALDKGTRVTCKATKKVGNDIWMQIPSGWIAAYYNGKVYVK